jgi:hypothetical protein
MAKVDAPFTITGTLDDLNFYDSADGNIVRMRGQTGITKKQFEENPIFDPIRQQGLEFGLCSKKAKIFKLLVQPFYKHSQDTSIFGRCVQLLLAILNADVANEKGSRQLHTGLRTPTGLDFLIGFEGNRARPLCTVLPKEKFFFDWETFELNLNSIHPSTDVLWPEGAKHLHVQLAIANWNCSEDTFETHYSTVLVFDKKLGEQSLSFDCNRPKEKDLWLCYVHLRFSYSLYAKVKFLHNKFSTTTLISYRSFSEE